MKFLNLFRNKEQITKYDEIPEAPADNVILAYIKEFIGESDKLVEEKGIIYTLEELCKIAKHFEFIENNDELNYFLEDITKFLKKYLNYTDPEFMGRLLFIIINMNLESLWFEVINPENFCDKRVKELINDAIKESNEYKYFKVNHVDEKKIN